jgi:hypothetical protein
MFQIQENQVSRFISETSLDEFLKESFNYKIIKHQFSFVNFTLNKRNNRKSKIIFLRFLNQLYFDFSFFINNMNDYEITMNYFTKSHFKYLPYFETLISNYRISVSQTGENLMDDFNQIIEREYISFYKFDYQKIRLNNFTLQYNELEQSKDSKEKLTNLISLNRNTGKVYYHKSLNEDRYLVVSKIGDEIRKLEKLQNLGLLSENIETNIQQNNQEYSVESKFKLANNKKTDFIKIISAMYDNRMFETNDGYLASNKQELMNEFGRIVNEDLSRYSGLLSKSKNPSKDVFLKPFKDIEKKAGEYYDKEG